MKFPFAFVSASLIAPALLGTAAAQPLIEDDRATWSLLVENDSLTREDDNYSSAAVLSYMSGTKDLEGFSAWLAEHLVFPRPKGEAKRRRGYKAGHLIYTPDNIRASEPLPDQHPYAGIVFADTSWAIQQRDRLDVFTLEIGAVGPVALAQEIQEFTHNITRSTDPRGWDNQIGNEPLLNLHYDLQYRIDSFELGGRNADVIGHMNVSAGNRLTHLSGGAQFRWGSGLDTGFGPPRVRPALTGSSYFTPTDRGSWYIFAGGDIRAVAHNMVLDNSFFRDDGPQLSSRVFVADFQVGGTVQRGPYQAALTFVARSPEYEEDNKIQSFGSVTLARKF
jgi:hypothetical protein